MRSEVSIIYFHLQQFIAKSPTRDGLPLKISTDSHQRTCCSASAANSYGADACVAAPTHLLHLQQQATVSVMPAASQPQQPLG